RGSAMTADPRVPYRGTLSRSLHCRLLAFVGREWSNVDRVSFGLIAGAIRMQVVTGGSAGGAVWNELWPNSAGRRIVSRGVKVFDTVEQSAVADVIVYHHPVRQSC